MPIFEYKCANCSHTMEFVDSAGKKAKHTCEKCQSTDMQKLFSTFAVGPAKTELSPKCQTCPSGGTCPHAG